MSFLVYCTFDLKNASSDDYKQAYAELAKLGLNRVVVGSNKNQVVIPTTSAMGELTGSNTAQLKDAICAKIQAAFRANKWKSEIFVTVGDDWAWGSRTT